MLAHTSGLLGSQTPPILASASPTAFHKEQKEIALFLLPIAATLDKRGLNGIVLTQPRTW